MPARAEQPVSPAAGATIPELDLSPQEELVVRGRDTANWVLSYSAVMPLEPPAGADWAADAREAVGRGALAETILILDGVPPEKQDAPWRIYRANVLLRIGLLDEAEATLGPALGGDKAWPAAQALDSVLASIRGQPDKADAQARQAIQGDPRSPVAWLALSYTQQAQGRLSEALESTLRAQNADPGHATGWTREAELNMALGLREAARRAADHALAMQPGSAIGHGVRALVALLESDWPAAKSGFSNAVRLNPSDANARFGLALVHIQAGDLPRARDELEIAIGRAPGNALFHAYLGRVYLGLGDRDKAWLLLERAKELDPNNPATWLFAGQLRLEENQPASALEEIRGSIDRNEGRKVYRASTLLNEDQALSRIDLSRSLQSLGFDAPALEQARNALEWQCCGATLRNLADAYTTQPHGLQARRSLALQSLFDTPLGRLPLELDVVQGVGGGSAANVPSHGLPGGIEARRAGLNEYSSLFASDGNWQAALDANVGGYDTWGEQLRMGGRTGGLGIGFAQRIQVSDGPDGKALDNRNLQFLLQAQSSPEFSAFLEYREGDSDREEVSYPFDIFRTEQQLDETARVARVGTRIGLSQRSHLKILYSRQWFDGLTTNALPLLPLTSTFDTHGIGEMPEFQYQYGWENMTFTLGASHFHDDTLYRFTGFSSEAENSVRLTYAYASFRPDPELAATLGLARGEYKQNSGLVTEYARNLPKLGLHWTPAPGTSVRLTALEAVAMPKVGGAGLEPVEVTGQQQWFGDEIGTVVRRLGLSWEQALSNGLGLRLALGNDRLSIPLSLGGPTFLDHQYERWSQAGLYWRLPTSWLPGWEGGLRLTYDRLEQERPNIVTDLNTLQKQRAGHWTLGGQLAGPYGLRLAATLTRVSADQTFAPLAAPAFNDGEDFWMTDLALVKTFLRGRGNLSVGIRNATNQSIGNYQEPDSQLPRFSPHRFTYARLSWRFD